ncbi:MAG: hypothetical protein ACRDSL_06860 [Pseudonocardiaceae bacterium]
MHPYHYTVYGPYGISQTLLGQWLGLRQPQVSRFETGPPLQLLDTLQHWARVLRIPPELLWFRLPEQTGQLRTLEPTDSSLAVGRSNGLIVPAESQANGEQAVCVRTASTRMIPCTILYSWPPGITGVPSRWQCC